MVQLSILTACLPSQADHLDETAESVKNLRAALLEFEIEVEWIICVDGPGELTIDESQAQVLRLGRHSGVGAARNIALGIAQGDFFTILDADDVIVLEGVRAALALLQTRPDLAWVACNRTTLDGERERHWHKAQAWGPKWLAWDWTTPFPFHPSTLVGRTSAALEVGGWPAMSVAEDIGFVLELSERFSGLAIPEILIRYRDWSKQATYAPGYLEEKELAYRYIETLLNHNRRKSKDPLISRPDLTEL